MLISPVWFEKRARLKVIINEYKPDPIIGGETHLDKYYVSSKIFQCQKADEDNIVI